jgi:hypothetical protein
MYTILCCTFIMYMLFLCTSDKYWQISIQKVYPMVKRAAEVDILNRALAALKKETNISFEVVEREALHHSQKIDAFIRSPKTKGKIAVEIKSVQKATIGAIAHRIKALPQPAILAAEYINPSIASVLKNMDIQFIDCAGNAYLNLPPLYICIRGQKQNKDVTLLKTDRIRAFDYAGLKVIYGFLCNNLLINASYREIAEQTGVANGSVGWVINSLKSAGYIIDDGKKRQLINRRKLLDRWVEAYPEKLKPKLGVGEFISDDRSWWKTFDIAKVGAYWGGEVAAGKYTSYLKPQMTTVYLPEASGNKLLTKTKLKKAVEWTGDDPGIVRIYRPFWTDKLQNLPSLSIQDTVHPILIYADLIASADSRNLETARKLYGSTVAKYIGED